MATSLCSARRAERSAGVGLRVGPDDGRVEVGHHGDLVVAADRRQYGADFGVGEGDVEVGRPVLRRRSESTGRQVLDRAETGDLFQPAHRLLVHLRCESRRGERRREHRHPVPRHGLRRLNEGLHAGQSTKNPPLHFLHRNPESRIGAAFSCMTN
jgi:hypothetical protein